MTVFELQKILTQKPTISLNEFLLDTNLTQIELIKIICSEELSELNKKYKNKKVLTKHQASKALDISYITLHRKIKSGSGEIIFYQEAEHKPVLIPVWVVAVKNYLKSNPIIPSKTTFSNLLVEI